MTAKGRKHMKYGYFDDTAREYVITRPDTPTAWANYLGSPEYGALISNNAGGYSFAKSGANGRILRYQFNSFDHPGRYIYLRDNASGDYWSASWQPVGKPLDVYESECRHGLGYTRIRADYAGIRSEASYYVPMNRDWEVWALRVTNRDDRPRELTVTGYAEFTNNSNYEQDQVNLQYSLFITRTAFEKNRITQRIHGNLDAYPEDVLMDGKKVIERFFGLAGSPVSSACGDRESFFSGHTDYHNPAGVSAGRLSGEMNYNGNSCGALSTVVALAPGETKEIVFLLGEKKEKEAGEILDRYEADPGLPEREIGELRAYWDGYLSRFTVRTPSPEFDSMMNVWHAYNCFMTFTWSRAASLIYCGLRNGYGYRDTVQDIQGLIHLAPEMAAEKIRFMLSAQVHHGAGLPLVKFTHRPGHEDTPEDASYVAETGHPAYRADDALWLFPTVRKYVAETGDLGFLDEVIPYADRDSGTVYDHLLRAVDFTRNHLGPHGMPAGLYADWNDCLRLGENGESVFVALQYYYALEATREFAALRMDTETLDFVKEESARMKRVINECCWDGDQYIRGFAENGTAVGRRDDPEAATWLNPQTWAVISGHADDAQAEAALDTVLRKLNTEYGAILMDPPFHAHYYFQFNIF